MTLDTPLVVLLADTRGHAARRADSVHRWPSRSLTAYDAAMPRTLWLLVLAACGPTAPSDTDTATTTGTTATTGTTDPPTSDTTNNPDPATTTTITTTTTDASTTSSSTTDAPIACNKPPPNTPGLCTSQTDRAACNNVALDPTLGRCYWVAWTSVRLVDGACSFGDPRGACLFQACDLACDSPAIACRPDGGPGGFIPTDKGVNIGLGQWCAAPPDPAMSCEVDENGAVQQGPPECTCLCEL